MKITLELEIGIETSIVQAALEEQAKMFEDTMKIVQAPARPTLEMYSEASKRLANTINEKIEQATAGHGLDFLKSFGKLESQYEQTITT